jgi:tetratricopeptide (TPR) repeat protein
MPPSASRPPERWPEDAPFFEGQASLESSGKFEELLRLYEARIRELPVPAEAAQLLTRAGQLAKERLKDEARAELLFRRALLFDPRQDEPLEGLRVIFEKKQDYESLAELFEQVAQNASGQNRASLLLRAADFYEQKLQRRERAVLCLIKACQADPTARDAFLRCRLAYVAEHRYRAAFESLERERAGASSPGLADDYVQLSEQLVDDPGEHTLAMEAVNRALELQPAHPGAEKVKKAIQQFEQTWRDRVRQLRTASLEERNRKKAARLSLQVAKILSSFDPHSRNKVKEALERSFLLWPAMPEALAFVERLGDRHGELPEAIAWIQRMAEQSKERAIQAELWARVASLRLSRLQDRSAALEALEKVMQLDPRRSDAVALAAELWIEEGNFQRAVEAYEQYLSTLTRRSARVELHLWISELCTALKMSQRARAHLEESLRLDPTDARAAYRLACLFVQSGELPALEPILQTALCAPRPHQDKVALAKAAAKLCERAGNFRLAFAALAQVSLGIDGVPPEASQVLESAQKGGDSPELASAVRRAARVASEPSATRLWRGLAELLQSNGADPNEALAAWAEVAKRAPGDPSAAASIEQLTAAAAEVHKNGKPADAAQLAQSSESASPQENLTQLARVAKESLSSSRWNEAAAAIQGLLPLTSDPERRDHWELQLANLYLERLSRQEDAAALLLDLLRRGSLPASSLGALEELASAGKGSTEICAALAEHYAKLGAHQRQAAWLSSQLARTRAPSEQKQLLAQIAAIHERQLADSRAAFDFLLRALALEPSDSSLQADAARLARDLDAQLDLARFWLGSIADLADSQLATQLLKAAADLANEAGATEELEAALKAALERSPVDRTILRRLGELYFRKGRFADCEQVLGKQIAVAEGPEKPELYLKLAEVCAELSRPSDAADAIQQAIQHGADESNHLPRLCDLLDRASRMSDLSEALRRCIELAHLGGDSDAAARFSLRRAKLLQSSSMHGDAVKDYSEMLRRRPSDPEALAALESLLKDPQCREQAAHGLIPAYEALKDYRKLVAVLDIVSETAQGALEKVLSLKQAAHIYLHQLRQPDLAFAVLARAMALSPGDANTRSAARRAAEDADALDSFAEVLSEILEEEKGADGLVLHCELADLYERKLNNRQAAIRHYRAALALQPSHAEALRALRQLYRAGERWTELAEVVQALAEVVPDPGQQIEFWREAGLLWEQKLNDDQRAAAAYRQIAKRNPLDVQAALALERLYGALDGSEDLAFALNLRLVQESKSPSGREVAFRLAQLRQHKLTDFSGALQLYRQILEEDPNHPETRAALENWAKLAGPDSAGALELLDPVLARSGDHPRRIKLREARISGATSQEKSRLASEIREIWERDLNQPELALKAAAKSFEEGLAGHEGQPHLERLAQATGAHELLAQLYERVAASILPGDPAGVPLLRRAAELREQLGQQELAVAAWKALLETEPQDLQALDHLTELYQRSKNTLSLAAVFGRKAQLTEDPERRLQFLLSAAEAYESGGDQASAIDRFHSSLAIRKTPEALRALDRLYGKAERWEEQGEVLELLVELSTDDASKTSYLVRRGQLSEQHAQASVTLSAYERALALSPRDPDSVAGLEHLLDSAPVKHEAARLLEPVYRALNEERKLTAVLELRAEITTGEERQRILDELATLREHLGEKSLAFLARGRAFQQNPENPQAREEFERLAAETSSFQELADAYQEQLRRGISEPLTLELWKRLATLYANRLNKSELAIRAYEEVCRREGDQPSVLEALARLQRQAGAFESLAAVIKRQISLERAVPEKVNLLFELGRLAEEALADRALAVQCYREVLERQPDDPNALKLLERVFSQGEQWQELASLFEREAQLADARGAKEEAFDLQVRGARVKLSRLEDPRGALDAFREVLQLRPDHPGAVSGLEELARSSSPLRGEAAVALEPLFAGSADYFRLLQMLEARASVESVPLNRVELLRRIAELYAGPMKNPEMAFVAATRALRELPDDDGSLHLCLRLMEGADALEDLSALLAEVVPKVSTEAARASMYRALARLQARQKDLEQTALSWSRVLEIYPGDQEALDAIARVYALSGKARELLDVLRRQLAAAQTTQRRALLLLQIGTLQHQHLNDRLGALATFRSWAELNPEDPAPLQRIEVIAEDLQRWPELADALTKRLKLQGETGDIGLKFRLAQVQELRLIDPEGALRLYSEILAAQPDHGGTLARLQEMVQRDPESKAAVNMLLKALRATRKDAALAATLELRAGVSPDPGERKALLLELASVRKQQGESDLLYQALSRAFREDPNDREVRHQLELAAESAGRQADLASAYEEQLPRVSERVDSAGICLTIGSVLEEKVREPDRAVLFYEKARQLDSTARARALPALDRLYTQLGKPEELSEVLEGLAEDATETQDKIGFLVRVGRLAEETLHSPDRAIATYHHILELDKAHLGAARRLEYLYQAQNNIDRLYAILRLERDLASGTERERIMLKMAQISAEDLSDLGESIELYRELLAKNPQNDAASTALEELYERAERFEDLRDLLAARIGQLTEVHELVRINDKLGRIHQKLGRKEEAVPFFRAALERDPKHRPALENLREIFGELGRKEDLIAVLRRLITLEEDAAKTKALWIRLAELIAETGRKEEALEAGRRSLEIEPHQPAELNRIHQVFLELKAYGEAVRALELRSQVELGAGDRDAALATLFAVADFWCGEGHKPESAGPALLKVLDQDPANRAAYERARQLYAQLGDWRSQAELIDRFFSQLVTEEEKVALLRELAEVREHKLGQKPAAFMAFCRALQLNASDATLSAEAVRLAEETGSLDELVAVYDEIGEGLSHGPLSEKIYLDLARVQDLKLDDPEAAEKSLRKILEFEPNNAPALNALAEMFSRRGRDQEYAVALEHKLDAARTAQEQKELMRTLARLREERLADLEGAAKMLGRALDLEPDSETAALLVGLYRRQQAWPETVRALERARELAASQEERARLQIEIAQLYERELDDGLRATEAYREALIQDPSNRAAIDALEQLYTKLDRPEELLTIYDRQLELSPDYRDKVKVFFKSAWIWEDRLQNLSNAATCIEGVLSLDPQNLQAIKQLERLRRAEGRWEDLAGVLERHLQLCTSNEEQSGLCVEIGDIQQQHLKQVDRAVKSYDQALELNPKNLTAIHALGTLYERSGNWPFALEMLLREIEVIGARPEAAQLHHRMGKINQEMLLDIPIARGCYLEALRISPEHLPTLAALKEIYAREENWDAYEKTLIDQAQFTEDPELKSRAFTEVGNYFADQKEDAQAAAQWYEQALKLVTNSFEAARRLADIYVGRENWDGSERLLEIVTSQMSQQLAATPDDAHAHELCRQFYRLGYVTEKLANKNKALSAYEKAYRLDATYLPSLEGLGNLLVQANRLDEALNVYQAILIHHREDLTDLEVVEIYWQLGEIHSALKQLDRAQNHYQKALALDPGHEPSLRALMAIADAEGQFDKSATYRQSLIKVLEGDAKLQVCIELGQLAREKLSDPHTAIDAYLAAHRLQPESISVMDSLYVLYRETKQGQKAAEMLEKILAQPDVRKDPERAKRVYFALGEISRDELGDPEGAVDAFNSALDLDHRFLEAFSSVEALLGSQKQWKQLEENYVRMIQRLPKTDDTHAARIAMWRALGELYLKVLKNSESALMAYQVAAAGLPGDAAVQETYAELLAHKPGEETKALAAYRKALPRTSQPGKVVSALAELAARRKDYDSAYLAAQVAQSLLGEATSGEREILTKLGPYARKKEVAQHPLTDRLWKTHLFHPKVRGAVGDLMAIIYQQVGHLYAVALNQYQINPKKHRIDVPSAQEYQLHHYRYVARLLGMEAVELYSPFLVATRERHKKRSADPVPEPLVGIEICHTHPVCLKVGGKFFSESNQKEIYYLIGRTLALLRPELALAHWLSPARLEAILQAVLSLSGEKFRMTVDPRAFEAERSQLQRALTEPARVALDRAAREYVRLSNHVGVSEYLEGTELTATRAGLFVAGEVEPVKRVVMGEVGPAYRVANQAKLRDLMVFATSEDLHELRAAVGTQVEVQLRK